MKNQHPVIFGEVLFDAFNAVIVMGVTRSWPVNVMLRRATGLRSRSMSLPGRDQRLAQGLSGLLGWMALMVAVSVNNLSGRIVGPQAFKSSIICGYLNRTDLFFFDAH